MSERKVATDALETLGTILDGNQKRDAIHLAVEPVEAGETLQPGCHITVTDGIARMTKIGQGLGIVDPFLAKVVKKGERFWFVMYPRMVTSLRHVWAHPNFPDEVIVGTISADKIASEAWLRNFCSKADCPDYETIMELITEGTITATDDKDWVSGRIDGDYMHFSGEDAHGSIPPEFWDHVEVVIGRKLADRPSHFSCSC